MAFNIPGLATLVEMARAAFASEMPGGDAHLWPNNLNPTAKVIGQMTNEALGYVDYTAKQAFILSADWDHLLLHGREYGLAPHAPQVASGQVALTASDALTALPGAILQRSDGVQYALTSAASSLTAGTLLVNVQALVAGAAGAAIAGTALVPVTGFGGNGLASLTAAVAGNGLIGGADTEPLEAYRARLLFRKQYPPHGGAPPDYIAWAMSVPGVTRAFVERKYMGPGSVRLFFLMDGTYANGIPTPADVANVQAVLDLDGPSGTLMTAAAPIAMPIALTITGLTPNNNATQAAVVAELAAAFLRLSRVAGNDAAIAGLPFLATPFTFSLGWLWQAVTDATGVTRGQILTPNADIIVPAGAIATLGPVTFQ